jgi:very-short-patch-repair endonuclease
VSARWLTASQVEAFKRKRAGQLSAGNASISPGGRPLSSAVRSNLEAELQRQLEASDLPPAQLDVPYLVGSRHRLDFCWPALKFGVEVQGGCHRAGGKWSRDIEKRARGLLQGWRILEVDAQRIKSGVALRWIAQLLST